MGFLTWALDKLDGWKSILGYLLAQIPFLGGHPMLYDALLAALSGEGSWTTVLAHTLLALGLLHKGMKELA